MMEAWPRRFKTAVGAGLLSVVFGELLCSTAEAYFCSKPYAPSCVSSWQAFADKSDLQRCQSEMERYESNLDSYRECLSQEADDAMREYKNAIEAFERRARR